MRPLHRRLIAVVVCACGALSSASYRTLLTPNQRQELETRVFEASLRNTFDAAREAIINRGYLVNASDFDGGILTCTQQIQKFEPTTALTLSLICPTVGDFYMERYGWGVFDLFFWPFSILWAAPSNFRLAQTEHFNARGTMSFEPLGEMSTRMRVTLHGVTWDTERYPVIIRSLQEGVGRQLFIKRGARPLDAGVGE